MSEVDKTPALGISLTGLAGTIVFQTHVSQDVSVGTLNAMVDGWQKVIKRQEAIADLVTMKKGLKVSETSLLRMREDRARIDAQTAVPQENRRNPNRASEQKLQLDRAQADANEKRYIELISEARAEIVATEALIAEEG
jgi:hypothetical protein